MCRFHVDFMKSSGFQVKSTYKTYKSNILKKNSSVWWSAVGRLCHVFTWNLLDFERSIARNGKPYVWSFKRKTYTWWSPKSSYSWNSADLIKSGGFHMKSSGFDQIWQISHEINRHNLPTALHKTEEFLSYLIYKVFRWISWNLLDFTKSTRFHKICQISKDQLPGMVMPMFGLSKERPILGDHPKAHIHEIQWILLNLADFMWISCEICQISCGFHEIRWISGEICQISCGFHEIQWISCEIRQISDEIRQISGEIRRISKGQLPGMVNLMFSLLPKDDFRTWWTERVIFPYTSPGAARRWLAGEQFLENILRPTVH